MWECAMFTFLLTVSSLGIPCARHEHTPVMLSYGLIRLGSPPTQKTLNNSNFKLKNFFPVEHFRFLTWLMFDFYNVHFLKLWNKMQIYNFHFSTSVDFSVDRSLIPLTDPTHRTDYIQQYQYGQLFSREKLISRNAKLTADLPCCEVRS